MELHHGLGIFTLIFKKGSAWISNFFLAFFLFLLIFSYVGYFVLGQFGTPEYSDLYSSLVSTMAVTFGQFDIKAANDRRMVQTGLFLLYASLTGVCCLPCSLNCLPSSANCTSWCASSSLT